jgi:hypothetical protein
MQRRIFVGSSIEGLEKARHVCEVLSHDGDVEAQLWTDIFEPGYLTFEALEMMLEECCAAVFVVTPDDDTTIRGKAVKVPRANVMLEFGLVAGRFGHHSVAVCQYGGAELPSDLEGLTVIVMDPVMAAPDNSMLRQRAEQRLKIWSLRMLATAGRIPRTEIVHGYAGRWDFEICLHTWRDLRVISPSYVQVKGYFDLVLPNSGEVGRGLAHGRLQFKLPGGAEGEAYAGEYLTAHEITNAVCEKDGSLELTTEAFALQKVHVTGPSPAELIDMDMFPEPWSAHWKLSPLDEPRGMSGTVRTDGAKLSEGSVQATKRADELN